MIWDGQAIRAKYEGMGYKIYEGKSSKNTIVVFLKDGETRDGFYESAEKVFGGKWDREPVSICSAGLVKVPGGARIVSKASGKQGKNSAGVGNEVFLERQLTDYIKKNCQITVVFKSPKVQVRVEGVTGVESVGTDTKGRKKADLVLKTKSGNYGLSLKKTKADFYESADTYWGNNARKTILTAMKHGLVDVTPSGNVVKLSKRLAVAATNKEKEDALFGSDLNGKGCVLVQTFAPKDFQLDTEKDELVINCHHIIRNVTDAGGDYEPVFLIRPDATRRSIEGFPGLRVLCAKKSATRTAIQIDRRKVDSWK